MKLSEMTNEAKSRWIAEKLEPEPTFDKRQMQSEIWISDGNCWWRPMADAIHDYDMSGPYPNNFLTDPACTVMLIENMASGTLFQSRLDIDKADDGKGKVYYCITVRVDDEYEIVENEKLGEAVADAWMLSMGYPEEG